MFRGVNISHNVLLVKLEEKTKSNLHSPLGILYVADALEKAGYNIEIFHKIGEKKNIKSLVKKVEDLNPLFVGFSSFTGMGFLETVRGSRIVKENFHDIPIVWGGVHPTLLPRETLNEKFIDIIVRGEGELTSKELALYLEKNKPLGRIKGIGYKKDKKIIINPNRGFIKNLDKFSPAWHLIDIKNYFGKEWKWKAKRVLSIVTSRGCPYRCTFCYNQAVHHRTWRAHSTHFVINQIEKIKNEYNIDGLIFHDDNFFVNKRRAFDIIEKSDLVWFGEVRANLIDENFARKLRESNCGMIFVGGESGSDRILREVVKKDLTTKDLLNAVKMCKKFDINMGISFIIGIPGETTEEMFETLDFVKKITDINPSLNVDLKIYNPYPGTPLWFEGLKYGFRMPKKIEEWGKFNRERCNLPWVEDQKLLENIADVLNLTISLKKKRKGIINIFRVLGYMEDIRMKKRFFKYCYEVKLLKRMRKATSILLS